VVDLGRFHDEPIPTIEADLSDPESFPRIFANLVLCLDVLEHLPEADVPKAIDCLAAIAPIALVSVANHSSRHLGHQLHLTQRPADWWTDRLSTVFAITMSTTEGNGYFFELSVR
jgi:hypothetical protein